MARLERVDDRVLRLQGAGLARNHGAEVDHHQGDGDTADLVRVHRDDKDIAFFKERNSVEILLNTTSCITGVKFFQHLEVSSTKGRFCKDISIIIFLSSRILKRYIFLPDSRTMPTWHFNLSLSEFGIES